MLWDLLTLNLSRQVLLKIYAFANLVAFPESEKTLKTFICYYSSNILFTGSYYELSSHQSLLLFIMSSNIKSHLTSLAVSIYKWRLIFDIYNPLQAIKSYLTLIVISSISLSPSSLNPLLQLPSAGGCRLLTLVDLRC